MPAHRTAAAHLGLPLLEPRDSPDYDRIARAAQVAGLRTQHLDSIEAAPVDAALIAVGPGVHDPLHVARHLRRIGSHALLVFFTGSSSQRAALHAELLRDPFLYSHCELVEVPANARQLASRMGRMVEHVQRASHRTAGPRQRPRPSRKGRSSTATDEHHLTNILAHSSDAIFSTDERLRLLTWNTAAERLFGLTAEAMVGQPLDALTCSAEGARRISEVARRVCESGEPTDVRIACIVADGKTVQVAVSIALVRDSQGELLGLSLIARDETEYQRVEEARRDANRQKDEFLAIMSHELRTPLTSILGYTDLLLRGLSGPLTPLTNKYVGNVRSAGDRLLELVNGLLDYTRLEAGVERLELRPVDLGRVVGQVVQQSQTQATGKQIDVRLAVSAGVAAPVAADEEKLIHVLRAMIGNALKFTPQGGLVEVRVEPDPRLSDSMRVAITDNGIGVRREALPRVWDRFYQGDTSLTRPYGGMGLGLSIARHLVTLHGGTVGASSEGPGAGSTFWFTLPYGRSA